MLMFLKPVSYHQCQIKILYLCRLSPFLGLRMPKVYFIVFLQKLIFGFMDQLYRLFSILIIYFIFTNYNY